MNIEVYIIEFLKKNGFCNLPGIGNFKLNKNKAGDIEINYSKQAIIDDLFSSFVGVNENVSINKATNAISTYSIELKTRLINGETVLIPGLGLLEMKEKNINFKPEHEDTLLVHGDNKNIKNISFGDFVGRDNKNIFDSKSNMENTIENEDETNVDYIDPYELNLKKQKQKNILKAILSIFSILIFLGLIGWTIKKMIIDKPKTNTLIEVPENTIPDTISHTSNTATTGTNDSSIANNSVTTDSTGNIDIVINDYANQSEADVRAAKLKSYGWISNVYQNNKLNKYFVYVNVPINTNTNNTIDSVKTLLNPKGNVHLLQK